MRSSLASRVCENRYQRGAQRGVVLDELQRLADRAATQRRVAHHPVAVREQALADEQPERRFARHGERVHGQRLERRVGEGERRTVELLSGERAPPSQRSTSTPMPSSWSAI